ncbi:MAG: hypothetical protein HOV71_28115 [Hamadaea sp.]|uniref:hypothetical protein n=1 Tax=Hamadaea sp. NPDC050747 TaxID=3155789 RepID=UPI0017EEE91A|nr:hypothetical protein [Hamadaea sp.]NUR52009.1 hypothetical protein [Hamadaea sp.]NUT02982.1 hypothetical protein [Hamadaea sp.]
MARRALIGGFALAAMGLSGLLAPSAQAAPAPAPNQITIVGEGLPTPLTIAAKDTPDQFEAMLGEVDFLATGVAVASSPKADKLGPKYTVTLSVDGIGKSQYDLYPLAAGGPRAFRPAAQPDKRKTTAGWFYGRLTMPSTMRSVGVPLGGGTTYQPPAGGGGGGVSTQTKHATSDISEVMGEWRRVVALNGAIVIVIAMGLFGIAFLIRRKV